VISSEGLEKTNGEEDIERKSDQKERKNGKGERMKRKEDQAQFPLGPFHLNERKREEGRKEGRNLQESVCPFLGLAATIEDPVVLHEVRTHVIFNDCALAFCAT